MEIITNKTFDNEREFFGMKDLLVDNCRFDGPADGESAFKECSDIKVTQSFFNLRYPFWHDKNVTIDNSELTDKCRAALWYSRDINIHNSRLHGIKALRECSGINITSSDIISPEFGWRSSDINMKDTSAESEYFMFESRGLLFENVTLKGKYSFQYVDDAQIVNCNFDTKDSFWHATNTTIKDSVIKGEYFSWYSDGLTLINCTIIGTQPLCYCKNLKLVNCKMIDCDWAFEKSEVDAVLTEKIDSIRNPKSGRIVCPGYNTLQQDDPNSKGEVIVSSRR